MKTKLLSTVLLLLMSAAGVFGAVLRVGSGAHRLATVSGTLDGFTLSAPAALAAGELLNVAEPAINNPDEVDPHGSTILLKGWELDGHAIPMPYTVTYADNGKKLRFWAANAIGVGCPETKFR